LNLERTGVYRYSADAGTSVLCLAYKVNGGPTTVWRPRQPVPPVFFDIASNPKARIYAHNAAFERAIFLRILQPRHGFPHISLERWRCTMAMALAGALPGKLENVAVALDLPVKKDTEGHKLMLRMCRPLRITKKNPTTTWVKDEASLERLCRYCVQDVEVEHALRLRLRELSDVEQGVWLVDQVINDRGFNIHRELAEAAAEITKQEQAAINAELAALTGGTITSANQVAKITAKVRENGHQIATLQRRSVSAVLAHDPDEETRRLLELRLEGSRASVRKFDKLFDGLDADDRLRGTLRYHAGAPGRWSGRLMQPQNSIGRFLRCGPLKYCGAVSAVIVRAGVSRPGGGFADKNGPPGHALLQQSLSPVRR
jgi:DNA polymerase